MCCNDHVVESPVDGLEPRRDKRGTGEEEEEADSDGENGGRRQERMLGLLGIYNLVRGLGDALKTVPPLAQGAHDFKRTISWEEAQHVGSDWLPSPYTTEAQSGDSKEKDRVKRDADADASAFSWIFGLGRLGMHLRYPKPTRITHVQDGSGEKKGLVKRDAAANVNFAWLHEMLAQYTYLIPPFHHHQREIEPLSGGAEDVRGDGGVEATTAAAADGR